MSVSTTVARFTLNETAARELVTDIIEANENGHQDENLSALHPTWAASDIDEQATVLHLLERLTGAGVIDSPENIGTGFLTETHAGSDYYRFLVGVRHGSQILRLTTTSNAYWRLGDREAVGVEAVMSVLTEAVTAYNTLLCDLDGFTAAK